MSYKAFYLFISYQALIYIIIPPSPLNDYAQSRLVNYEQYQMNKHDLIMCMSRHMTEVCAETNTARQQYGLDGVGWKPVAHKSRALRTWERNLFYIEFGILRAGALHLVGAMATWAALLYRN